jgi:hypothetical protein
MDSILITIKKMLGILEDDETFDLDILIHINAAFATLTQMGVGPSIGFTVDDASVLWSDFITDTVAIGLVKNYIFMQVKLCFDSSSLSSAVIDTLKNEIAMYEWRLNTYCDI